MALKDLNNRSPVGNTFCIAFNTTKTPGVVHALQVTLEEIVMMDDESVRVDITDHPLYQELRNFCIKNLPHGKKRK